MFVSKRPSYQPAASLSLLRFLAAAGTAFSPLGAFSASSTVLFPPSPERFLFSIATIHIGYAQHPPFSAFLYRLASFRAPFSLRHTSRVFPPFSGARKFLFHREFQILQCQTPPLAWSGTDADLISGSAFSRPSFFPKSLGKNYLQFPLMRFSYLRDLGSFFSGSFTLSHFMSSGVSVRPLPFRFPEPDPLGCHLRQSQVDRTSSRSTISVSEFELIASQLLVSRLPADSGELVSCQSSSDSQPSSTCSTVVKIAPVTFLELSAAPVLTVLGWSLFLSQDFLAENVSFIYHPCSSVGSSQYNFEYLFTVSGTDQARPCPIWHFHILSGSSPFLFKNYLCSQ